MNRTVGAVAKVAGVSVRTLHHYDDIGLVSPAKRGPNGYREYGDADLTRLQQVLFYRELGFPLDEIAALLDGGADPRDHLLRQRRLLAGRIERLQRMAAAVEHQLEAGAMGVSLTPEERFEVFGDFDPDEYAGEAEQRWGDTDAISRWFYDLIPERRRGLAQMYVTDERFTRTTTGGQPGWPGTCTT